LAVQTIRGTSSTAAEKPYMPYGAAMELMRCTRREVLLAGPSGTGKSRACLEKLNLVCMQVPIRAAIVRKVRKSITQSAMVTFEEKVLPQPSAVRFHEGDQEYRYPSGARIIVSGLDDAEKLKSTDFDMVYVQEATELDSDDWGILLRGLRNNVLPYQQILADCNPGPPDHWLKVRCDDGETLLLESRHEDNPELYDRTAAAWSQFGLEYMRTLDSLKGVLYQRLRLGQWVAAEGMYFTEWDPSLHVCPPFEVPQEWPRWISVDYGFAAPFCCLWFARCPEDRRIYVYRECYATGLRDEQQAELILARTDDERLNLRVLDPSMFNARSEQQRPSIAQVYAALGVYPVFPGMNSRKQGWAVVRRAMAHEGDVQPRLQVLAGRAPNLCREIPSLVMDQLDPEDVADVVQGKKIADHAADALRYGLCAEAQPPLPHKRKVRWG
jgi:phage terminase large subunit